MQLRREARPREAAEDLIRRGDSVAWSMEYVEGEVQCIGTDSGWLARVIPMVEENFTLTQDEEEEMVVSGGRGEAVHVVVQGEELARARLPCRLRITSSSRVAMA